MRIAFDPIYAHPLPEGHRFPMLKYELIPEQLLHEGSISRDQLFSPEPCKEEIVLLTHNKVYVDKLNNQTLTLSEQRKIGFPQSPELTLRERMITQGTVDCCAYAIADGIALNAVYLSGVDILASDKFGKLNVSMEGCKKRDELVFQSLKENHIPVVVAMGGGYSPDIKMIVEAHCNTFRVARDFFS
jgi:acetoin utilization deacetylase AcuC-like enzyme